MAAADTFDLIIRGKGGHTTMLLGAAKYLAASKNFRGTVHFIFQPAEEGGGGGDIMVKEGLFEKFHVDSVFGIHNWTGLEAGYIGVGEGPIMAAADTFDLIIRGKGGHTTMLLGAAKYLAASKNFRGTVHFIFQPAEEGGGGGDIMVKEGLFEKFHVDSVFGIHNWTGLEAGYIGVGEGPIMAAADTFDLIIRGKGGHTTMLLGAAKYLAASKNFRGTVHLIFQPAEEGGGGGEIMVKEGLFEKFPVDSVFGMHNWTGLEAGHFGVGAGPSMAAADTFDLIIHGKGGHAAMPHQCIDPIIVASQVLNALQSISSRSTHAVDSLVISVTQIHAGDAYNIIPDTVRMHGTVRTFLPETRNEIPSKMLTVSEGVCTTMGASCELNYVNGYPATRSSHGGTNSF
jgi:metal-dependent amidase/aminoacylase/carboxypeptidase family protein